MKGTRINNSNKINLSTQRKLYIYYYRIIFFLKILIIIILLLFFFTSVFDAQKNIIKSKLLTFSTKYGFVLENIIIEEQKNASLQEIIDALGAEKGAPIFAIDLNSVKEKIEQNVWVKAAIIERRLPSTIYIAIIERTPIAIWQFEQKLYLIDSEGNRISAYNGQTFENLVHVVGQDANIYAQSLIEDLKKHPNLALKLKSAVRYGQRRWNLNFKENITVKMPENDFALAYDYLCSLDKEGKLFNQNYKMIDLRDHDKYYLEKYSSQENSNN